MSRPTQRARLLSLRPLLRALLLALCCAPAAARAHQQSLSYGDYRVRGAQVEVKLRVAAADLAPLLQLDPDGDGKLTQHDLDLLGPALPAATLGELKLRSGGADCALAPGKATLEEQDGISVAGVFTCPADVEELSVRVELLELLAPGHTHLARFEFAGSSEVEQRIAQQGSESFSVDAHRSTAATAVRFLLLGVEHIFTGYDHIAFLVGLLLLGGTLRALVGIVTSFTLAHSITLALAALDIVAPPPRLIEPLIALSIVFVAAENLWALRNGSDPSRAGRALGHRWMITFAFGLIHGFGFAAALRELHLPRAGLAASLVTFNLGVELGQVCIVAVTFPLLRALGRDPRRRRVTALLLSGAVGALGLFWFAQRIVSG